MDTEEKNIHVLYYTPGKNIMGLTKAMQSLHKLYGNRIIALPKDITKLSKNDLSLNDLLSIRTTINLLIVDKLNEENKDPNKAPDMRVGAIMSPVAGRISPQQNIPKGGAPQNMGNIRPGGGYQPQNGPQRPPVPPTSGSNAVTPAPLRPGFFKERIDI